MADNAAVLLRLKQQLDSESVFMLLEPAERAASAEALARQLAGAAKSDNSVVIIAVARACPGGPVRAQAQHLPKPRWKPYLLVPRRRGGHHPVTTTRSLPHGRAAPLVRGSVRRTHFGTAPAAGIEPVVVVAAAASGPPLDRLRVHSNPFFHS